MSKTSRRTAVQDSAAQTAADVAQRLRADLEPLVGRARDEVAGLAQSAAPHVGRARDEVSSGMTEIASVAVPLVVSAVETVSGVLEDAGVRGGAAWDALRGDRVGPPVAVRRWPWAVGAALAGAAAGVVTAWAVARVRTSDAPDAVEPEQVQAVVDRPDGTAPTR